MVGGGNSAAEAALDLWRSGARVLLVHRGPALKATVKYWLRPDVDNRIAEGSIEARSVSYTHLDVYKRQGIAGGVYPTFRGGWRGGGFLKGIPGPAVATLPRPFAGLRAAIGAEVKRAAFVNHLGRSVRVWLGGAAERRRSVAD